MKKILTFLAAAVIAGCAKPLPQSTIPSASDEGVLVPVRFLATDATKAVGIDGSDETHIGRWTVFAFGTGGWYTYKSSENGGEITMNLRAGTPYRICAIVNYPTGGPSAFNPGGIRQMEDLTGKVASLADNAPSFLQMFGTCDYTPAETAPGEPPTTQSVNVSRLVSRIDLRKISVDFSATKDLQGKRFTLSGIYVTNAYRTSRYGADYDSGELSSARQSWYNTMGWHRGENADPALDRLLGDIGMGIALEDGSVYETAHSFYAFPNPTAPSDDSRDTDYWSPRSTRLVIEGEIEGTRYYYPIRIPAMKRNVIYSADNVIIRDRGSLDPEAIVPGAVDEISYTLEILKSSGSPAGGLKVAVGGTHQLKAIYSKYVNGVLEFSEDVTSSATWTSTPNAAVSSSGKITGITAGPATITVQASPEGHPVRSSSISISVITWSDDWDDDPEIEL